MKTWFALPVAVASMVMMVGSVALASSPKVEGSQQAPGLSGKVTRSHSGGAITIDVSWLRPDDVSAAEKLTFEVRMNTHSVDLEQYDMADLSRLEVSGSPSIEALGWFNPGGGGHHRYGVLNFSAKRPDGSPVIQDETRFIEVVIQGVGGVPERRFRWDLLLTKTEKGRKSKWAQGVLSRRSP
jgi:hypothetical protein